MKRTLLILPLFALAASADPATNAPLVRRNHSILPVFTAAMLADTAADPCYVSPTPASGGKTNEPLRVLTAPAAGGEKERAERPSSADWLRNYAAEHGVGWPEGSSLEYRPTEGLVAVCNTEENHARLADALARWQPYSIRTQARFVSATPAAFAELGLEDVLGATLAPDERDALLARLAGHPGVEVRDCATTLSRPGTTVSLRSGPEITYPTEFTVEPFRNADGSVGAAVEPLDFNTRYTGANVHATATPTTTDDRLSLEWWPWWVFPPVWHDFAGPGAPAAGAIRWPFFPVFSLATLVDILDGRTQVHGGAVVDEPGRGPRYELLLVSAERVLDDGRPFRFVPTDADAATPPGFETLRLPVLPAMVGSLLGIEPDCADYWLAASAPPSPEAQPLEEIAAAFQRTFGALEGVAWPDGSFARFDRRDWAIVVRNTPDAVDRFRAALARAGVLPYQIRIRTRFLSVEPGAFDALGLAGKLGVPQPPDAWAALRAALDADPRATTRACPSLLLRTGVTATVKGVTEVVYPTEFEVKPLRLADRIPTNMPPRLDFSAAVVEPQEFNTREVGQIVTVTPTLRPDVRNLSLDLEASLVLPPAWEDAAAPGSPAGAMEQPVFRTFAVKTFFELSSGCTALLGGALVDDPAAGPRHELLAVTAEIVDMEGRPIPLP